MQVAFRADANSQIGTGHVMRCLALAETLVAHGARCVFLCRAAGIGALAERITASGHTLIKLPEGTLPVQPDAVAHAAWLPHGWREDARLCQAHLANWQALDWLVVDHYALAAGWQQAMRTAGRRVMVIDDLADRPHNADLLLDQNLHVEPGRRYASLLPTTCQSLFGPRHALLRPEFAAARDTAIGRRAENPANRLLIMFGGADKEDLTARTLKVLADMSFMGAIDVVVGPLYADLVHLQHRCAALPGVQLHHCPADIAGLLAHADLAIGSPGVSTWERCAVGLPAITLTVADNQRELAEAVAANQGHFHLGRHDRVTDADLAAAIHLLWHHADWRARIGERAASLCDGGGAQRVARIMLTRVSVRPATLHDAERLFAWRNDPRVRQQAFDSSPLVWEAHLVWLQRVLPDRARLLLIGETAGEPCGCVRFDMRETDVRVSLFLDPARFGEGLAVPLLRAAEAHLRTVCPDASPLLAEVRAGNAASWHSFIGAGYTPAHHILTKAAPAAASD